MVGGGVDEDVVEERGMRQYGILSSCCRGTTDEELHFSTAPKRAMDSSTIDVGDLERLNEIGLKASGVRGLKASDVSGLERLGARERLGVPRVCISVEFRIEIWLRPLKIVMTVRWETLHVDILRVIFYSEIGNYARAHVT